MSGNKLVYQVENPKTQSTDAVKALLAFKKVASDPLPQDISLDGGRLVLVLSNKKDAFYTVTARACSCPAATYHHGPCKHQRKYFGAKSDAEIYQARQRALRAQAKVGSALQEPHEPAKRLAQPPEDRDSIKPTGGWIGPDGQKVNGPMLEA